MTALLQCDGCGNVVGERADDQDDPTRSWWALSPAPSIGSIGLLPVLDLSAVEGIEDVMGDPPEDLPPLEPPRHFCSDGCGETWFRRRREAQEAAG